MKCPQCSFPLDPLITRSCVVIDICTQCKGTWLDQGEINFFVKDRKALKPYSLQGLIDVKEVLQSCPSCPRCLVKMKTGKLPGFQFEVEECPSCQGLWLEEQEFKKIGDSDLFQSFAPDHKTPSDQKPSSRAPVIHIPSFGLTTTLVLGSMYAVFFGLMVFLVEAGVIPYMVGIFGVSGFILFQFLLGPILMDWSLGLWGSLTWIEYDQIPLHLRNFITETCAKNKIPLPRIGIINDGAPQAYTYGRTPKSARLVLSRGILEILEPAESEAVVAHEIGHITHWDFVIMTLAEMIPLIFYHIFRICSDLSHKKSDDRDSKNNHSLIIAAVIAYFAYVIADYLVMFVSRVREYWADKFSIETTKNPNALVSALSKIAYGLAATPETNNEIDKTGSIERRKMAVQALGIMSVSNSKEIALYASQKTEEGSTDLKEIMRWDLWSPWASYYELHSTHPLTAKRLNAIAAHALNMGIEPALIFDLEKPESYWDDFIKDVLIMLLPVIGAISAVTAKLLYFSTSITTINLWDIATPLILGLSAGGMLKTFFVYPGGIFLEHSILSLLKKVKVSPVTSYPVKVKGRIIGRGDPGNIFSEDMVIRDKTGMIFLDYEHGISDWFFALFKMNRFMSHDVEVEGWYRRAPIPFLEVKTIKSNHDKSRSYTYYYRLLLWIALPTITLVIKYYLDRK